MSYLMRLFCVVMTLIRWCACRDESRPPASSYVTTREDLGNLVVQLTVVVQNPGVILRYDGMGVELRAAK